MPGEIIRDYLQMFAAARLGFASVPIMVYRGAYSFGVKDTDNMPRTAKFAVVPIQEKLTTTTNLITDKKGGDVLALDLTNHNTFTEGIIIVTASSVRHAQGLADHLLQEAKARNYEFLHMEGYQTGQWILLDMNDLVISIFQEETRELYRLEDLWKNAPIIADTRDHTPAI